MFVFVMVADRYDVMDIVLYMLLPFNVYDDD